MLRERNLTDSKEGGGSILADLIAQACPARSTLQGAALPALHSGSNAASAL